MKKDPKISYNWNYDQYPVYGLPMSNHPLLPLPTPQWILKAINRIINIIDNVIRYLNLSFYDDIQRNEVKIFEDRAISLRKEYEDFSQNREITLSSEQDNFEKFLKFSQEFSNFILTIRSRGGMETTQLPLNAKAVEWGLDRFNSIFQNEPLPAVANYLRDDSIFAYWRVAGNNPVMIERVSELPKNFPLKNSHYQEAMGTSDSLTKAINDNRLYIIDYKNIGAMTNEEGYFKTFTGLTYAYAPIALFAVPSGKDYLMPVAIQTGQDPAKHNIFVRNTQKSYYWGWQMAKYVVQVAEETYHEIFTHLAYTHLISEVFSVATVRNLSSEHVLYRLLKTHFEGTTFINWGATIGLIRDGQFIDNLFSAEIEKIQAETLLKRFSFDFFDMMLPNDLERRGVKDGSVIGEYPYRDDGLLIWNAIHDWVSGYTNLYYLNDNDVIRDAELNKWVDDIIAHGKISGFKKINSVDMLNDVLTMVIFTASAQHAAVNFTQPEWQRYAPAMSGTTAAKPPYSRLDRTNSEWLSMLANYDQALQKYVIYSLLGGVYHGQLGRYTEPYNENRSVFTDVRVTGSEGLLANFRRKLLEIETTITKRNVSRPLPYTVLLPSRIPASTNI